MIAAAFATGRSWRATCIDYQIMNANDLVTLSERGESVCEALEAWPDRLRSLSAPELDAWETAYEAARATGPSEDDLRCGS